MDVSPAEYSSVFSGNYNAICQNLKLSPLGVQSLTFFNFFIYNRTKVLTLHPSSTSSTVHPTIEPLRVLMIVYVQ